MTLTGQIIRMGFCSLAIILAVAACTSMAQAATRDPVFSLAGQTFSAPRFVAVSIPYNGITKITRDGTTPSSMNGVTVTGPILISWSQTIKAISIVNSVSSNVVSQTYVLDAEKFRPPGSGTTAPVINLQLPTTGQ